MKVIVALGNPGKEYEGTRHNMGYMVVDKLSELFKVDLSRSDFNGIYTMFKNPFNEEEKIILAKPETFMNLSGQFVSQLMSYFKVNTEDLLVIYDDMALKEGVIRLRPDGSSGGQKGIQNIIDLLHSNSIKRIRVGIGEPISSGVDWVLSKPSKEAREKIEEAIDMAAKAAVEFVKSGFDKAMSLYNGGQHG